MTAQQSHDHSGLMSWIFKTVGLAGAAVFLASGSAFARNNTQAPVTAQNQHSQALLLAQDVEVVDEARFGCEVLEGEYTVMYYPESQPGESYAWATPSLLGGGWTPERRCAEISRRLELYRPDGLQEMQTAVENGYDIICVTTQEDPNCRIVLTVPPGQDPELTRDRVFENLTVADNGVGTEAVNTFTGSSGSQLLNEAINQGLSALGIDRNSTRRSGNINLRPFLDPRDGGTGTQLRGGTSLNPNRFR